MTNFTYSSIPETERKPTIGLIVLQSDETVEPELHRWLPPSHYDVLVSRVPSGEEVTAETLGAMAGEMTRAASLFPRSAKFCAVGYCCTSGTSVIGADEVSMLVREGCDAQAVTNPLSALVQACKRRDIKRLAFLSPYIETVSGHLRSVLSNNGIDTPVFGSFNEGEEAKVAWIDATSIKSAVRELVKNADVQGVFLSCTNLKTFDLLEEVQVELGIPVLSSNYVLAEELAELAGVGKL